MTSPPWLAQRVRSPAPVPAGCVGLLQSAGTTQLFAPGEQARPRLEETLWWVSTTATIRTIFAPNQLTPEAGLSLYVGPVVREGRLLFNEALGDWLKTLDCDTVTADTVVAALRYRAAQALRQAMLPCLQADELAQVKDELNRSIEHGMGLYCEELFRVDLAEAAEADAPLTPPPDAQLNDAAATRQPPSDNAQVDADEFQRNERYAEARFFRELPLLCKETDHRRPVAGQADAECIERARALLLDLRALTKTRAGRRPQVPTGNPRAPAAAPEILHLMALASRRAAQGLDAAWAALTPAEATLDTRQIAELELALQQMQQALDQRFTPWWGSAP